MGCFKTKGLITLEVILFFGYRKQFIKFFISQDNLEIFLVIQQNRIGSNIQDVVLYDKNNYTKNQIQYQADSSNIPTKVQHQSSYQEKFHCYGDQITATKEAGPQNYIKQLRMQLIDSNGEWRQVKLFGNLQVNTSSIM
ncbi:UNKNOWN [Stylonychia lemnae]|uniref:Uncharacterized protein n=1 Tax=Stylonychia lemnae TaxID=5949 RepID=A0A078B6E9_STYLE|nr:UNKNOWN [Stylonychia lemnae]|eukprot:CDW89128.1 UNKNOWN [Stylonychia lemnae]